MDTEDKKKYPKSRYRQTNRAIGNAEKRAAVLKDRIAGMSMQELADKYGYKSMSGPSNLINRAVKDIYKGEATEYVELTLDRLEQLLSAVWDPAMEGEIDAHEQARKVVADMRKMLGIDKPAKTEITGKDGAPVVTASDLANKLDEIAKRNK